MDGLRPIQVIPQQPEKARTSSDILALSIGGIVVLAVLIVVFIGGMLFATKGQDQPIITPIPKEDVVTPTKKVKPTSTPTPTPTPTPKPKPKPTPTDEPIPDLPVDDYDTGY